LITDEDHPRHTCSGRTDDVFVKFGGRARTPIFLAVLRVERGLREDVKIWTIIISAHDHRRTTSMASTIIASQ
jgi:hypothetical protein